MLPPAVRILAVEEAEPGFHARFSARAKAYEYRIVNAAFVSPFINRFAWHLPVPLDVDAMRGASTCLVGTHDFAAFQGTGAVVSSTRRTIYTLEWESGDSHRKPLVLRIDGSGFLRHMVRNIVGTLVEVGAGRWPVGRVAEVLESRDRRQAGTTAPALGLFLMRVIY